MPGSVTDTTSYATPQVERAVVIQALNAATQEEQMDTTLGQAVKDYCFSPLALGLGAFCAFGTYGSLRGMNTSNATGWHGKNTIHNLNTINRSYLPEMVQCGDAAIAAESRYLSQKISAFSRTGMTNTQSAALMNDFTNLQSRYYKATGKCSFFAKNTPGLHRMWKGQGGRGALIFGTIFSLMEIIPAFTHKTNEKGEKVKGFNLDGGLKQMGRSLPKLALDTAGMLGGMALGAKIGSILPGAGTLIGAGIGALVSVFVGNLGMAASNWLGCKLGLAKSESTAMNIRDQEVKNQSLVNRMQNKDAAAFKEYQEKIAEWMTMYALNEDGSLKEMDEKTKEKYDKISKAAIALGMMQDPALAQQEQAGYQAAA